MANETKKYELTLLPSMASAAKPTYYRGGLKFSVNETQVLELTKEEVEVFKNDPRIQVKSSSNKSEPKESGEASVGEEVPRTDTPESSEEESSNEVSDSEDKVSTSEEEASDSAPEVTEEVKDITEKEQLKLNREKLNAYAKERGIEAPEQYETKKEVVDAIAEATK
jgi:hypothetical protein